MVKASIKNVDFTGVKERGRHNRNRIPAGDYLAKVTGVVDGKSSKDEGFQYIFDIKLVKRPSSVFPYYCKITENQLWKLRGLLIAAGISVPKTKTKVDPNRVVGKLIGVTIEDADDYNDREQSEIGGVFPASELEDFEDTEEVVDDSEEEDEEEEETEDAEVVEDEEEEAEEEEEDEGDEYDAMERLDLRKALAKLDSSIKTSKAQSDDDIRNLIREKVAAKAAAATKKTTTKSTKKKVADVSDDELEELDIDDL